MEGRLIDARGLSMYTGEQLLGLSFRLFSSRTSSRLQSNHIIYRLSLIRIERVDANKLDRFHCQTVIDCMTLSSLSAMTTFRLHYVCK